MSPSTTSSGVNATGYWSDLVPEILDLILQRLAFLDWFTFGKVCTSWRSIFITRRRHCLPPPCIILLPNADERLSEQPLWCLHEGQFVKLRSPRPAFLPSDRIVQSSMGWLAMASTQTPGLHLMNPITNERIPLSSTVSNEIQLWALGLGTAGRRRFYVIRVKLSSVPTSDGCIVVVDGYYSPSVGVKNCGIQWCRPGDTQWTEVRWLRHAEDMVFHKGELYAVIDNGDVMVYKFDSQTSRAAGSITSLCGSISATQHPQLHLVESCGEILLVLRSLIGDGTFDIFKPVEETDGAWMRVESLGDRVLLVGNYHGSLENFSTKEVIGSGFEANCIYQHLLFCTTVDLVKSSMADRSCHRITNCCHFFTPNTVWIIPQVW